MTKDHLSKKYQSSPSHPGVYLMKDDQGEIIYVGKAVNLKKRLSSYFVREGGHDLKTKILIGKIADFEFIVTATEHEALILESNLIKTHRPRYNVLLKDGKNYPLIRLDISQDYPSLEVVRKIKGDGALYFGPYSSSAGVRSTIKTVNKIFRLRKCKTTQFRNRTRPCLNFQINACLGVCCHPVPRDEYHLIVRDVVLFLKGRAPELIRRLKQEMGEASCALEYERAAYLRDTVSAIEKSLERQVVVTPDLEDRDVAAWVEQEGRAMIALLFVRSGYLVGTRYEIFEMGINTRSELLEAFLGHYYGKTPFVPGQILLSDTLENQDLIGEHLTAIRGKKVVLHVPVRGEKRRLVEMAEVNGRIRLKNELSREAEIKRVLIMLQHLMDMDRLPRRMECFDNSHLAGTDSVSSMVVFTNGVPDKGSYRKFILKDTQAGDDYGAMTEVLTRRFRNGDLPLPDLLVVDGGKGQLAMAVAVLEELGLSGQFCQTGSGPG